MTDDLSRYVRLMDRVYPNVEAAPKIMRRARAVLRICEGENVDAVASSEGFQKHWLNLWSEAIRGNGFYYWLDRDEPSAAAVENAKNGIAQMLLAELAEKHFEATAKAVLGTDYFIRDDRQKRTDTDYVLEQSGGFRICRFNIKFHGTLFRDATQYVGLDPTDCFALATYKIASALEKHHNERLPYVFLVLSVPDFPTADIARSVPNDLGWLCAVSGRSTEEAVVRLLCGEEWVSPIHKRLGDTEFRAVSARRAHNLMREKLFERVYALKQRAFNQKFRRAEIDMHISLSTEMLPFRDFLELLVQRGIGEFAITLDRGEI